MGNDPGSSRHRTTPGAFPLASALPLPGITISACARLSSSLPADAMLPSPLLTLRMRPPCGAPGGRCAGTSSLLGMPPRMGEASGRWCIAVEWMITTG